MDTVSSLSDCWIQNRLQNEASRGTQSGRQESEPCDAADSGQKAEPICCQLVSRCFMGLPADRVRLLLWLR